MNAPAIRQAGAPQEDFTRLGISPELSAGLRMEAERLRTEAIGALFLRLKRSVGESWRSRRRAAPQPSR